MRTLDDLRQKQGLPLEVKVLLTRERIRQWVNEYGEDGVYVSFSGGKDSTVLLDLVRNVCGYTSVPAVFVDVPTQYPELKEFVKTYSDVEILKPKISFMEVCSKYGFPLISKEVSETVSYARKYLKKLADEGRNDKMNYAFGMADLLGIERRRGGSEDYNALLRGEISDEILKNAPVRLQILFGKLEHKDHGVPTGEYSSMYDRRRYQFFLDAPFEIGSDCCKAMKKAPIHKYARETGRMPMTAQMADESLLRRQQWVKFGCNGFDRKNPLSNPMSFWTEQDVLQYIAENNLPICSVYGKVIKDCGKGNCDGQLSWADYGLYEETGKPKYKCTGCKRTGCMLCGFGCHMEKSPNRFELLKKTHPKMYALLDTVKNSGVTMREAIEWTNAHSNLNIRL